MRTHYITGCLLVLAVAAGVAPAQAGESVILVSGSRLHADRHELSGETVRIIQGEGFVELAAASIVGYEPDEAITVIAPAPKLQDAVQVTAPDRSAPVALPVTPHELAASAARKYFLPESFVKSVMKAESNFRVNALSPKGAIGLMQLMQSTAQHLGVNPKDPRQNAEGGAQYLRELLAKYEHDPNQVILALAAYNAGPEAVEKYHGVPPYRETREYILRVLRNWDQREIQ